MKSPAWLNTVADWVLGQEPRLRRHVLFLVACLPFYIVNVGVTWQTASLGLISQHHAELLAGISIGIFSIIFILVRSGWSQTLSDPALTFPHAVASVGVCILAFMLLGAVRANVLILIGQVIVTSMFGLRPHQILKLGLLTAGLLTAATIVLCWMDPVRYTPAISITILAVGGPTLLTLSLIAKWVSDIRVRIGRQTNELSQAVRTLEQMATSDMLTGLYNRRVMTDLAEEELKLMARTGTSFCVALIDLDHFKSINDRFGHHAGDTALIEFASTAVSGLRQVDKLSRWGGEEFLLMLPQLAQTDAYSALERLRQSIERLSFEEHPKMRLTFSAGIAQARVGECLEQLIDRADQAVYEAKKSGRNRCVVATAHAHAPQEARA